MLSHRKPLAALLALSAALAVAIPVASASAAPTVDPTVCQLLNLSSAPFGPAFGPAQFLGGASLQATLANSGAMVGCPAP